MLFNSLQFAIFLPIVFLLYWFLSPCPNEDGAKPRYSLFRYIGGFVPGEVQLRVQNLLVVIASYIFYGWWDYRFLFLIAFTSVCSWCSGLLIGNAHTAHRSDRAKAWMIVNIILNLSILGVFKYYDFFITEFCSLLHIHAERHLLHIILPVGISFYTFQALSYSIDVYRGKITPTKDVTAFFAFIAFFPQLVAGPIERASNLLPQFATRRTFSYRQAIDGSEQILWGLFKKIVIADNCAAYVDPVWVYHETQDGTTLIMGAVLFTFQIYGDFSGYSDIAIGTAKLFGIRLIRNFNNPYFSRDIAEFWRRWHISLTTWFKDYVYIPLGGSRPDMSRTISRYGISSAHVKRWEKAIIARNTLVIFLLSGIWHGANWTFVAWGVYHALIFMPLILFGRNRRYTQTLPTWKDTLKILITFCIVTIGWVIFRADSITSAWNYLMGMYHFDGMFYNDGNVSKTLIMCVLMVLVEWVQRDKAHPLDLSRQHILTQAAICLLLVEIIIFFLPETPSPFIYFQF